MQFDFEIKGIEKLLSRIPFNQAKTDAAIESAMEAAAVFAQGQLIKRIPVRTGQTRGRITYRVSKQADGIHAEVGGKSIAASGFNILRGLEEGTGLYGPYKQRIYPKTAKALRWNKMTFKAGGAGGGGKWLNQGFVFAKSISGMQPRKPFARTKQEAGAQIQRVFIARFSDSFDKG